MASVRTAAAAIALGQTDLEPLLGSIDVPTLVIHGQHDTIVAPEISVEKTLLV